MGGGTKRDKSHVQIKIKKLKEREAPGAVLEKETREMESILSLKIPGGKETYTILGFEGCVLCGNELVKWRLGPGLQEKKKFHFQSAARQFPIHY